MNTEEAGRESGRVVAGNKVPSPHVDRPRTPGKMGNSDLESITVLGGGTGTPKLIQSTPDVTSITVVANTGDDVEFGSLFVCPDVDACLFVTAGMIDRNRWWGIEDDTTIVADTQRELLDALDLDTTPRYRSADAQTDGRSIARWRRFEPLPEFMTFGDVDRAIHRARGAAIDAGYTLTEITRRLCAHFGTDIDILPMTDDPVATLIHGPDETVHFQEYWVDRRGAMSIDAVEFRGVETATPTDAVTRALDGELVVIGPSNPVTSIGPMLALDGGVAALETVPVIAVSPFLGDVAFSGPAIDLMRATGLTPGTAGLVEAYPFLDGLILDEDDQTAVDVPVRRTDLTLDETEDAERVWSAITALARDLT